MSKIVLCGKRNTFAKKVSCIFSWQAQDLGDLNRHFAWQAQHFRCVALHALHSTLYPPHFTLYAPHSTLYTPHSTLHTPHFALYAPHSTLHTPHLHSTLYTPHSTLYTPHSTLYTPHFKLHTPHSTLHTPHFTLHATHFTLYTPHITFHTLHSTVYTPHSTLYTPHYTLHTLHSTLYAPHFTLYTPHFTLHTLHFTLQTLHFTLYTPPFTLYTPHFTLHTPHFTLYTLHSTLYTSHSTLYTPHSTLHTLHSTLFHIPQSIVHWYGNRGNMHKNVQLTCFKKVFYVTAFGFVGCILLHSLVSQMEDGSTGKTLKCSYRTYRTLDRAKHTSHLQRQSQVPQEIRQRRFVGSALPSFKQSMALAMPYSIANPALANIVNIPQEFSFDPGGLHMFIPPFAQQFALSVTPVHLAAMHRKTPVPRRAEAFVAQASRYQPSACTGWLLEFSTGYHRTQCDKVCQQCDISLGCLIIQAQLVQKNCNLTHFEIILLVATCSIQNCCLPYRGFTEGIWAQSWDNTSLPACAGPSTASSLVPRRSNAVCFEKCYQEKRKNTYICCRDISRLSEALHQSIRQRTVPSSSFIRRPSNHPSNSFTARIIAQPANYHELSVHLALVCRVASTISLLHGVRQFISTAKPVKIWDTPRNWPGFTGLSDLVCGNEFNISISLWRRSPTFDRPPIHFRSN